MDPRRGLLLVLGSLLLSSCRDDLPAQAVATPLPTFSLPASVKMTPTAVPASGSEPPGGLPGVACGNAGVRFRPTSVTLACADAGQRAENLVWQSWTRSHATADGTYVENDCRPACVSGHLITYVDVSFRFLGPLYEGNFSRVEVTFHGRGGGPEGVRRFVKDL